MEQRIKEFRVLFCAMESRLCSPPLALDGLRLRAEQRRRSRTEVSARAADWRRVLAVGCAEGRESHAWTLLLGASAMSSKRVIQPMRTAMPSRKCLVIPTKRNGVREPKWTTIRSSPMRISVRSRLLFFLAMSIALLRSVTAVLRTSAARSRGARDQYLLARLSLLQGNIRCVE